MQYMHLQQLQTILPGTVVLTPNQRLATFISEQFDHQQVALGKSYWESPTFLTIDRWVELCWEQGVHAGTLSPHSLLSDAQTQTLWEDIIRHSDQGTLLLNCSATASIAKSAWDLLNAWQIRVDDPSFQVNEDTRCWRLWAKEYIRRLNQQNNIDNSQIINLLISTINASANRDSTSLNPLHHLKQVVPLLCPKHLLLIGCTELTPQQHSLFSALKKQECQIEEHSLISEQFNCQRIALKDTETEIRTMALWAKQLLAEHRKTTICCVVPQLQQLRNSIIQHFGEILAPETVLPGAEFKQLPFNISAGRPLSAYPIVHCAIHILSLASGQLPITNISILLRTPFLGAAEQEMCARAQCDANARQFAEHYLSLATIINTAKNTPGCEQLVQQLETFDHLTSTQIHFNQSPSKWAKHFSDLLCAIGWPGERSLNSVEYQLVEQWQQLLRDFSGLDNLLKPLSLCDALAQLQHLANQQIFQPQSSHAPIQILDVMEATGMVFDFVWVMGLTDTAWPIWSTANPFLPLRLQQALNMPHTSADQEWRFTQQLTTQFQHSATEVMLSYAQQENDFALRPSSLIMQHPEITITDLGIIDDISLAHRLLLSAKCEEFIHNQAPPLSETERISGGSALFKQMAACPFRAFAQFRLAAEPLATAVTGLPTIERGKLVHHILEYFWKTVKTHENLCRYSDDQLNTLIKSTVTHALIALQKTNAITLRPRFFSIEQRRLVELMTRWLAWEKTRTPFTVIATEQRFSIKMGLLNIKLQADRIDFIHSEQSDISPLQQHSSLHSHTELSTQMNALDHYAIIDYKTSKISIQDWFGDRPNEPQLPLYCIASATPISTLAFAQIRSDELVSRAFGDTSLSTQDRSTKVISGEEWQQQKRQWQLVLNKLSEDFQQGMATVDPKNGQQTCQYCHLKTLCRIHETK